MRRQQRWSTWLLLATMVACFGAGPGQDSAWGQSALDLDGDTLPDDWEVQYGLDASKKWGSNGKSGDPDHDGLTNLDELQAGTHPRSLFTSAFAEGATGDFFDARFALFNPDRREVARVLARFFTSDGAVVARPLTLGPRTRVTIDPERIPGLERTAFSVDIASDRPIVADRTMMWDAQHFGSHAETGVPWPSTTWYFAEGATHSGFDLFYLVQNPSTESARVDVSFLLPSGDPVERRYALAPNSRFNVWVNQEDPLLAATDVSAVFVSETPIVVERAMYRTQSGRFFDAGHAGVGMTSPAIKWFLAEGATGDFFDLFVLVANAERRPADIRVTYLLPDGTTIVKTRQVAPQSRTTIWVDADDPRLAETAVSTTVESTNGTPILVERAIWWPGGPDTWYEAHAAKGVTAAAASWALAEGETGGPDNTETFILVANVSATGGVFRVTIVFEDGLSAFHDFPIAANSRFTVDVGRWFPEAQGQRYASLVESLPPTVVDLVVERAMYSDSGGVRWAAGTDAAGTPVAASGGAEEAGSAVPTLSLSSAGRVAQEAPTTSRSVNLTRSDTTGALTAFYSVLGSASPSDHQPLGGVVSFAEGEATVTVTVTPVNDTEAEPDETVIITLAAAPWYLVGREASATIVIADDDSALVASAAPSTVDAVRFLNQATFGPAWSSIADLQAKGYERWFDEQVQAPVSPFLGYLDGSGSEKATQKQLQEAWFQAAVAGPDQLRQRVANALLETMVVSTSNGLWGAPEALASYMDILMRHAFGNFRTLLGEVTLSPAMGRFLDMLRNTKGNPKKGSNPNENFARELLQLFTIGLHRLNLDGSPQLDALGLPIPTYGQTEVEGFARVFTGWTYHQDAPPFAFWGTVKDWRNPMTPVASHHEDGPKTLLDGAVLPAGQGPVKDLQDALDVVFAHPNVGPFLAYRLIQRLVTSNPSPGYVARVASVFNDNGVGVRGDLEQVVKAILFDAEARQGTIAAAPTFGHLREPMISFVSVLRAFDGRAPSGRFPVWYIDDVGQAPFRSPSVFNFFSPFYRRPGIIADAGLTSPEFQIASQSTVIELANTLHGLIYWGHGPSADRVKLNLWTEQQLAVTPDRLLDRLDVILFGGRLSPALRQVVLDAVNEIPIDEAQDRARAAVSLLVRSPEYLIQK